MKNKHKSSPVLAMALLVIVSLACGNTSTPIPTLDPNAIQTVIEQTASALEKPNTPTNIPFSTGTPSPTNSLPPPATETTAPLPSPTILPVALGASCIPNNPPQTWKVVDVVDGDTIKVLMDQDGQTYTIRYIGMDTPESTSQIEYFGPEAASKNVQLVFGKNVILIKDVSDTDRYGRLLRYVLADNLFIADRQHIADIKKSWSTDSYVLT
jgi:endonuclease YncB( thermonuclease family)